MFGGGVLGSGGGGVYGIRGDGCLQESITRESCADAGLLGLRKSFAVWDDNGSATDGRTVLSLTENMARHKEAYGWQVLAVQDGG